MAAKGYNSRLRVVVGMSWDKDIQMTVRYCHHSGGVGRQTTKFLEEALGVVGQKIKKPEYHQHGTRTSQQKLG